ncbi:hypothetical protein [Candidatus Mycoplasma haematohominis]|uniref:Uncharacterized protein n=1 Tax=Candidatus Mycoplasma haematohominis TaxID=1494318 RepID=A0A478FRJ1_9MOLU|nr:hypothetical protein [Candidatus Mycoplasma haemohominis]GCE63664.1 hypothetical protein MHSWG343_06640 [Candidatus Mycoplasma haemohominis]
MDPIKVAIAGGGVALAIGGGIGISMISSSPWTLEQALDNDKIAQSEKTNYTDGSKLSVFGDNKKVLVADIEENESWWNARYKEKLEKLKDKTTNRASSSEFLAVNKGYSSDEGDVLTALNKVCDASYKKEKTEFNGAEGSSNKVKYREDIGKFCTLKGTEVLQIE